MDVRIIRANIALFMGKRTETRRLLNEYLAERGEDAKRSSHVMWLDAQSQTRHGDRIKKLSAMVEALPEQNYYRNIAGEYLEHERKYEELLKPQERNFRTPTKLFGVPVGRALVLIIAGGVLSFIVLSALNVFGGGNAPVADAIDPNATLLAPTLEGVVTDPQVQATSAAATPSGDQQATPAPVQRPDKSQVVAPDQYTVRYDTGNLQITAFEYDSERVIDVQALAFIEPLEGAVFYALKLRFECRRGVCYNPPEARVAVILSDGTEITPKPDTAIAGEQILVPKAAGQFSDGWVVFEVPVAVAVAQFRVAPTVSSGPTPAPLVIDAPVR